MDSRQRSFLVTYLLGQPGVPSYGDLRDADCIFAPSFGRNSIQDTELGTFVIDIQTQAIFLLEGKEIDALVFELMNGEDVDVGVPNKNLAAQCKILVDTYGIPLIAQWEVCYALWLIDPAWYRAHVTQLHCIWPPNTPYFSAEHVLKDAVWLMKAGYHKNPYVVAHPAMIARVVAILWKLGVSPVVEGISAKKALVSFLWAWDPGSIQAWCRSYTPLWRLREFAGRWEHILRGRVALKPPAQAHKSLNI